jgi:hypothetical protein
MPPHEDSQQHQARIIKAIDDHEKEFQKDQTCAKSLLMDKKWYESLNTSQRKKDP